jgi:hypothetical protein
MFFLLDFCLVHFSTLKMDAVHSSVTSLKFYGLHDVTAKKTAKGKGKVVAVLN